MSEFVDIDFGAVEVEFADGGGGDGHDNDRAQDGDPARRRGVKRGTKRGKYQRVAPDARRRIVDCFNGGGDWKAAATANGIAVQTAYGFINRPDSDNPRPRGGPINRKVQPEHVDKLMSYVEANPLMTLKGMAEKLRSETGLHLSTSTIHHYLDGRFFTLKKVLPEPVTMNSEDNKRKRAEYVQRVMEATGAGKTIMYMDETNCNLFLRRSQGRSRRGTRCCVKAATSRGPNVHVIGAICQTGLVFWERRRGSFLKEDCAEWLRQALRRSDEPYDQLAVVCDNAPVHAGLERVVEEDEFAGVLLIRSAPYSAPLNPIEECWSVMKAAMKREMAASFTEMMETAPGLTQQEHRLRYLESKIDDAMPRITPLVCLRSCNHVQRHFAACMALTDLAMGE